MYGFHSEMWCKVWKCIDVFCLLSVFKAIKWISNIALQKQKQKTKQQPTNLSSIYTAKTQELESKARILLSPNIDGRSPSETFRGCKFPLFHTDPEHP